MARIVIVGAGMGGLCAALRLAAAGHEVTVCESGSQVGGKLGIWSADGFVFDTGPSLITMPQVFAELFSDVGKSIDDHLALQPLDPIARYRWADGTVLDTVTDSERMADHFDAAMGGDAADDWARLMARAERIWRAVEEPVLRSPVEGMHSLLRLAWRIDDLMHVAPHRTLRDLSQSYLRDPRQRMMIDRYATYTGSDPRRAPAALLTVPYAELAFGGWYVAGGLYRLAEVVADLAVEHGARIRLHEPVAAVTTAANRVDGVLLASGRYLDADVVVSAVDARILYGDLLPPIPAAARLRRTPASLSGFVMLLGLTGTTTGLAHHNVLFPTDYDAEFDALFGKDPRPVADPTIYISRPTDPASAPPGTESWFVLVNAPRHARPGRRGQALRSQDPRDQDARGQIDWDDPGMTEEYADHLLEVMARRGFDVRDRIVVQGTRSPADLERDTGAPGGAIYGSSSNGPAAAFLRAANASPVHGLFLVGGSAHPGGGLPLVALSAALTAELIGPV